MKRMCPDCRTPQKFKRRTKNLKAHKSYRGVRRVYFDRDSFYDSTSCPDAPSGMIEQEIWDWCTGSGKRYR